MLIYNPHRSDRRLREKYNEVLERDIKMQGLVIAEYIWIGGKGSTRDLRSKSRTLVGPILGV